MKPERLWTKQHDAFLYFDPALKPRSGQPPGVCVRLPGGTPTIVRAILRTSRTPKAAPKPVALEIDYVGKAASPAHNDTAFTVKLPPQPAPASPANPLQPDADSWVHPTPMAVALVAPRRPHAPSALPRRRRSTRTHSPRLLPLCSATRLRLPPGPTFVPPPPLGFSQQPPPPPPPGFPQQQQQHMHAHTTSPGIRHAHTTPAWIRHAATGLQRAAPAGRGARRARDAVRGGERAAGGAASALAHVDADADAGDVRAAVRGAPPRALDEHACACAFNERRTWACAVDEHWDRGPGVVCVCEAWEGGDTRAKWEGGCAADVGAWAWGDVPALPRHEPPEPALAAQGAICAQRPRYQQTPPYERHRVRALACGDTVDCGAGEQQREWGWEWGRGAFRAAYDVRLRCNLYD
ncbi:hypothetical protein B0H13DRAFT_2532907 [Mycena leptocephala]|nr:hypothetical protein B0H13DRAFT_2532907 [Mycena leptocephala]